MAGLAAAKREYNSTFWLNLLAQRHSGEQSSGVEQPWNPTGRAIGSQLPGNAPGIQREYEGRRAAGEQLRKRRRGSSRNRLSLQQGIQLTLYPRPCMHAP